jgi:hypothetical protein
LVFELFARENLSCGCEFAWFELQEACLKQADLKNVLSVEENLVVVQQRAQQPKPLQKPVRGGRGQLKLKRSENLLLHFEHLGLCKFVFADGEEVSEVRRVDLFIFG